jgi:Family of unknown function (DUF5709)
MAQRDYEEQPEAPDLGASVQLESEEHLGAPAGGPDGLDAGYSPPDRPYLAEEDEVTARGMREGASLDERLRSERGDEPVDTERSGRIELAGAGAALETPDAMEGVDLGIDGGAAGAEEAAVHITDDPGGAVEREPSVAASPELDDPEMEAALDDAEAGAGAGDAAAQAARDVRADGDVFDPGLPGAPGTEQGEEVDAERIDRQPGSGGAAGVDGRQDAGPDAWR